jgi:hypothetical protein
MAARLTASVVNPARASIGVSMNAGQTALMRIPLEAYSSAAAFVRPRTPCFAAVYADALAKPTTENGRIVDDGAAMMLEHFLDFELHAVPDAREVHGNHTVPRLVRVVSHRCKVTFDASVVERDAETAVCAHCGIDEMFHVGDVRHVRAHEHRFATTTSEPLDHPGTRFLVDIAHDEPRTGACERLARGPADAGPSTGDKRNFSPQLLVFHKPLRWATHVPRPRRRCGEVMPGPSPGIAGIFPNTVFFVEVIDV